MHARLVSGSCRLGKSYVLDCGQFGALSVIQIFSLPHVYQRLMLGLRRATLDQCFPTNEAETSATPLSTFGSPFLSHSIVSHDSSTHACNIHHNSSPYLPPPRRGSTQYGAYHWMHEPNVCSPCPSAYKIFKMYITTIQYMFTVRMAPSLLGR